MVRPGFDRSTAPREEPVLAVRLPLDDLPIPVPAPAAAPEWMMPPVVPPSDAAILPLPMPLALPLPLPEPMIALVREGVGVPPWVG